MAVDSKPAGSPAWWLERLGGQLDRRVPTLTKLNDYYEGRHPLLFASEKFREAFGGMFAPLADNWCQVVVDAVEERLNVEGFRFPADGALGEADEDAWRIWQENGLDAESQIAHTEALVCDESYAMVWVGEEPDTPQITIEHGTQMVVARDPANRRRILAALKRWVDEDEFIRANLYLPDQILKFRSKQAAVTVQSDQLRTGTLGTDFASTTLLSPGLGGDGTLTAILNAGPDQFVEFSIHDELQHEDNPWNVVPVVPISNRPRLLLPAQSELRSVIPLQDAANKLLADMLLSSEYGAFRQRWVTGLDIPVDPQTQEPLEPFKAAVDRLFISENPETRFGDFPQTDLTNFVQAIEMVVQHVASQSRTPPHYFYLAGQFPSGESIKAAETGLVAKARRKMRHFGEAWENTMRLAFRIAGDEAKANAASAETIWGDPESRTESEHIDALTKKATIGVPQQQLWEDAGYSPQQIERFRDMQKEQAKQQAELAKELFGTPMVGMPPAPGAPGAPAPLKPGQVAQGQDPSQPRGGAA